MRILLIVGAGPARGGPVRVLAANSFGARHIRTHIFARELYFWVNLNLIAILNAILERLDRTVQFALLLQRLARGGRGGYLQLLFQLFWLDVAVEELAEIPQARVGRLPRLLRFLDRLFGFT